MAVCRVTDDCYKALPQRTRASLAVALSRIVSSTLGVSHRPRVSRGRRLV